MATGLSSTENLLLGCTAGVGTKLLNYPLLVWKNASQQGLPISLNPSVIYRGLPMACINLGGTTAVQFWFTGIAKNIIHPGGGPLSDQEEMGAAFLGGLFSGIPGSMWELTMIQQQRFGGSLVGTPKRLIAQGGAATLTRGIVSCMGRESLYTMAMLGLCPVLQREFMTRFDLAGPAALVPAAFLSSLTSATFSHPMDTIKTCMQGDVEQKKYTTLTGTAKNLVAEYGLVQGLFKGLAWRITLITSTFFAVNQFKQMLMPALLSYKAEEGKDAL